MNYSILIKELKEKLLLTHTELAKEIDVSFASANRWKKGRTEPTIKAKRKIRELCKKNNIEMEKYTNE